MEELQGLMSLVGQNGLGVVFAFLFYLDLRKVINKNTEAILYLANKQGVNVSESA